MRVVAAICRLNTHSIMIIRGCCPSEHVKKAVMPKPAPAHFVVVDKPRLGGKPPPTEDDDVGEFFRPGEGGDDSDLD